MPISICNKLNLAAISLVRFHAIFLSFAHRLVKKKKKNGAVVVVAWITAGFSSTVALMSTWMVFFSLFYVSYLSFHLLCHFVILWSYTTKAIKIICGNQPHHHGATNREKETVQDTAYCVSCIFTANDALYFFFFGFFILSLILFQPIQHGLYFTFPFYIIIFCQLSYQSSSLRI